MLRNVQVMPTTTQDVFQMRTQTPSKDIPKINEAKASKEKEMAESEKKNIPRLIQAFLGYTTAHGFSRLGESKGIFWKVFWACVCLGSFGMFTFQCHGLITLYLSRPVTTSVRITFEKQVPFPAVTICNLNMLRTTKLPASLKEEMLKLVGKYNGSSEATNTTKARRRRRDIGGKTFTPSPPPLTTYSDAARSPSHGDTNFGNFHTTKKNPSIVDPKYGTTTKDSLGGATWHQTTSNWYVGGPTDHYSWGTTRRYSSYNSYDSYDYYDSYRDRYYVQDLDYLPSEEDVQQNVLFLERFTTAVTKVQESELTAAGHQFEDFVTECTWRGVDCKNNSKTPWFRRWHYKYGNCYTFNAGIDQENQTTSVLSTSKPGPSQGLSLRLDIEQMEYLRYVSDSAGVRVMLHDQGMQPFPYLEGFSVSPGMSTSVGIQKTLISRVDRFNNNTCWNIDGLQDDNLYKMFYNVTKYTQQTCHNSCVGKSQLERCGCSEYSYPSSISACDTFNSTIRECLKEINYEFNNDLLPCMGECRQPCREDVIQKTISMSQWPSIPYMSNEKKQNKNFSSVSSVLLNIFYNQLNYERIEEDFVYDEINLLADIGGQLGLWIGVSVITVFELIELFVLIISQIFRRTNGTDRGDNETYP